MAKLGSINVSSPVSEPEVTRNITILDEEPAIGAPELQIEVAYVKRETWKNILRPLTKKGELNQNPTAAEEKRFRHAVVNKAVRGWKGLTLTNLCRLSDAYFDRRDQLIEEGFSDTDEVDFDIETALVLCEHMNSDKFAEIVSEIGDLEPFVLERGKQEKKEGNSSSD